MKRFTPDAIKARTMQRLRQNKDSAAILEEGTLYFSLTSFTVFKVSIKSPYLV